MSTRRKPRTVSSKNEATGKDAGKGSPRGHLAALAAVGVVGALVAAALYVYSGDGGHEGYDAGNGDELAPDFSLVDTEGNSFSIAQHRGSVIIIDFMATWCEPCKTQVDNLKSVYASHAARGVIIVSVDVDGTDTNDHLHSYKLERGATWQFALDTAGAYIEPEYSAMSIPTIVIIDQEGKIAKRNVGAMTSSEIIAVINPLLGV